MNSDLDVSLRDECRVPACSRRGTLALLHSLGPNKTRARRPHAPRPQVSTNLVPPDYRPEIVSAQESLVRTTRRQRRTTSARQDVGSRRGNRVAAPPRVPPTLLSHDCFNNYLIGIADCRLHQALRYLRHRNVARPLGWRQTLAQSILESRPSAASNARPLLANELDSVGNCAIRKHPHPCSSVPRVDKNPPFGASRTRTKIPNRERNNSHLGLTKTREN